MAHKQDTLYVHHAQGTFILKTERNCIRNVHSHVFENEISVSCTCEGKINGLLSLKLVDYFHGKN